VTRLYNIGARSDPARAEGRGEQKEGGEEDRCPWGAPSLGLFGFVDCHLHSYFPTSGLRCEFISPQSESPLSPPHLSATSFSGIRFRHAFPGYDPAITRIHAA
jgi:hypothetical protein